ncbi:MAG: tRNA preQ1(34) S-adenosylmethionine ribosyltransferase-isomerase QueA [Capsulimonadaceae bacterium]
MTEPRDISGAGHYISDYDYVLPADRIAQTPAANRDDSRLLVLDRETGAIAHRMFRDLPEYLSGGDVLVLNDTRVTAMRLFVRPASEPSAAENIEVFLVSRVAMPSDGVGSPQYWQALVRPGRKMLPGMRAVKGGTLTVDVVERTDSRGGRLVRVESAEGLDPDVELARVSQVPLPPYISTRLEGDNKDRYQTVYARHGGSAAAPTAGLHFTPQLLTDIGARGVEIAQVTLHVGPGTFRPVVTERIDDHEMHAERYIVSEAAAVAINGARGRVIAVGTTSARTLEASAVAPGRIVAGAGDTRLYVTPGYRFEVVDALVTNFHMPRSTLLLLVSAFAGRDRVLRAYEEALSNEYRFLSFGDAMLIV